jgi:hypothetical protein|tara:strand:+ start:152 stop:331 length:180 start_codon:yes stop_codon:yes gene_type:complete
MSKIKNLTMQIEEFCDGYFYGGEIDFTIEEVSEDVEKYFGSADAGKYAKNYIEKTLKDL